MANNLLQQILEGRYSKEELENIVEHSKYAIKTYEIAEKQIEKAQKSEYLNSKLKEIYENLNKVNSQIEKMMKREKLAFASLLGLSFPTLIAIAILSSFIPGLTAATTIFGIVFVGMMSIPLFLTDKNTTKLLKQKKELETKRAEYISSSCFTVSPEFSNNIFKNFVNKNCSTL